MAQPLTPTSSTSQPDAAPSPTDPASTASSKKRKRDPAKKAKETHTLHTSTLRSSPWTYFHLRWLPGTSASTSASTSATPNDLDPLTTRTLLTAPLVQFLGTHGASISIDILNIRGQEVWIRVPVQDGKAVAAAVAGWIRKDGGGGAWRVCGRGGVLGRLGGMGGEELFG